MKQPSLLSHLRDIILLPFTVTVIIPYLIYDSGQTFIPGMVVIKIAGFILLAAGITLLFYTIFLFGTVGKGTLAAWSETQKLVIQGPYKYTRNPMISGVLFILIGEALLFHSTNILIWAGIFFVINNLYFFFKEEPDLEKRFGDDYRRYKQNVPRWVPRVKAYEDKNKGTNK